MDSINRNQPETNHQNLSGIKAVEQIRTIVESAGSCFLCSAIHAGESNGARPMSVRKVDDDGNLWFLSAVDSHKNQEISVDSHVRLYFQGSSHSDFMYLNGTATVTRDRAKIDELWHPLIKTWFTEGKDDPRITVIKVTPTDGYYWDTKHGDMVAGLKMVVGAAISKTLDDSIEGKLKV
jgi:general stress protein 26